MLCERYRGMKAPNSKSPNSNIPSAVLYHYGYFLSPSCEFSLVACFLCEAYIVPKPERDFWWRWAGLVRDPFPFERVVYIYIFIYIHTLEKDRLMYSRSSSFSEHHVHIGK